MPNHNQYTILGRICDWDLRTYVEGLDVRIIHRLSLTLIILLACLLMEPACAASLGSSGYFWPYYPCQVYVEQYNILDIETPSGSVSGIPGQSYSYSTSATDTDGDQVFYTFYWGDGSTSVTGRFDSGISVTVSHSWSKAGTYKVKATATDADIPGLTSGYSGPLTVTIRG